jgi:hypothetical protein
MVEPSSDAGNGSGAFRGRPRCRLIELSPRDLDPHSILLRHQIYPSATRLSEIAESWDPANLDPIHITRDGEILKGLEEWEFARKKSIATSCRRWK